MPVCVDASVLLRWLIPQQLDPQVYDLVDGWLADGLELVGPGLLFSEVVSVLRHKVHQGVLEENDAGDVLSLFLRLGIRRVEQPRLYRRAYDLASRFGHSRAYDAHYLAAAEAEGCDLWTADRPLYQSVRHEFGWVRHLSQA